MAEPNSDLVRRAQQGDEAALVELIEGQQRYLYSIALGVVRNPTEAEDVTQNVVVRLLRALPSYRAETRFTTWLYRLAVNMAIDHLRRTGKHDASLDATEEGGYDIFPDADPAVDPIRQLDQRETAARIQQGLGQLSPVQRAALTLYYFEDLSYEEIAATLELPLNTLKSTIRRAKLRLAQVLTEEDAWTAAT
jgi:RNA polymerase sigma-70 factor (ECF subfamily)